MTSDSAAQAAPLTRLGTFELVRHLSRSALGELWEGRDTATNRAVFVRVVPDHLATIPDVLERLRNGLYSARLDQPQILSVEFVGQEGSRLYFVSPFVKGMSLAERLAQTAPLSRAESLAITSQVLQALSTAHAAGIVHGNLQPACIRLEEGSAQVCIADFRLGATLAPVTQQPGLPPESYNVDYLSPEQTRGGTFGPAADLYALGVVLFQMLSGRLPFQAETRASMSFQHMYEPPPGLSRFVPDVPGPISAVIERLLIKDPADRYQTTTQVQADLAAYLHGDPLPSRQHADEIPTVSPDRPSASENRQIESPSRVRHRLVKVEAEFSQLQRERDELSARLLKVDEAALMAAGHEGKEALLARTAQWALIGGLLLLGGYLGWNTWKEYRLAGNYRPETKTLSRSEPRFSQFTFPGARTKVSQEAGKTASLAARPRPVPADGPPPIFPETSANQSGSAPVVINSLGMPLRYIPAAVYFMGSHEPMHQLQIDTGADRAELADEYPQHIVKISQPFYVGQFEVRQGEYAEVMGNNPSAFSSQGLLASRVDGVLNTSALPVENVSWEDAVAFCRALSALPAEKQAGRSYRLPTEAEWEFACRGGGERTAARYPPGVNLANLASYGWFPSDPQSVPRPVGEFLPNPFGLYDMLGNVGEWCQDLYVNNYYGTGAWRDPAGPLDSQKGPRSVRRGPRCSLRGFAEPQPNPWIGFRVVCTLTVPTNAPALSNPPPAAENASSIAALEQKYLMQLENSLGMRFVRLPPGKLFHQAAEPCLRLDESQGETATVANPPRESCHPVEVTLSQPYWLGQYEVTGQMFERVLGRKPVQRGTSLPADSSPQVPAAADKYPVESVSWYDAVEFCRVLSNLPEERRAGRSYRLPTEVEWVYAASSPQLPRLPQQISPAAGWLRETAEGKLHPVGTRSPGPRGVFDQWGNAAEWLADAPAVTGRDRAIFPLSGGRSETSSPATHQADAVPWRRLIRGGSYRHTGGDALTRRSAAALEAVAGFRVVLEETSRPQPWSEQTQLVEQPSPVRHAGEAHGAVFSFDQQAAFSVGDDGAVRVWNLATGKEEQSFVTGSLPWQTVALSRRGRFLATGNDDGDIALWDVASRKPLRTMPGHQGKIYALVFGPNEVNQLLSAGEDRTVRIWNVETGVQVDQFVGRDECQVSLASLSNGSCFFAGGNQGSLMQWRSSTGHELPIGVTGNRPLFSLQAWADDHLLISGRLSQCIWNSLSAQSSVASAPEAGIYRVLRASPNRQYLAGGTERGALDIFGLESLPVVPPGTEEVVRISPRRGRQAAAHAGSIRSLQWSLDGQRILTSGGDGQIRLWWVIHRRDVPGPQDEPLQFLATASHHPRWLSGSSRGVVRRHDSSGSAPLPPDLSAAGPPRELTALAISRDGTRGAAILGSSLLRIWDLEHATLLHEFDRAGGGGTILAFNSNGSALADQTADHALRIWDLSHSPPKNILATGHTRPLYSIAFIEEGRKLVTASGDGTLRFWNAADGKLLQSIPLGLEQQPLVRIAPDGRRAYLCGQTSSGAGYVSAWSLEPVKELGRWFSHRSAILSLEADAAGRYLAVTDASGVVSLVDVENTQQSMCELAAEGAFTARIVPGPRGPVATVARRNGRLQQWELPLLARPASP